MEFESTTTTSTTAKPLLSTTNSWLTNSWLTKVVDEETEVDGD